MNSHWRLKPDSNGILWLGLDYARGSVNLLSGEVLEQLDGHLEQIERDLPKAIIVHSLKDKGFVAGADVREFVGVTVAAAVAARIRRVHSVLDRLEALPCPTLALIRGFCLGGGLELALACRYRVASDEPTTRLGFPEVHLGIFPAYGGTWRSIRNIGPLAAMRLMLTGRTLRAQEARGLGLVDRAVPLRQLKPAAIELLGAAPQPHRASLGQRLIGIRPLRGLVGGELRRQTAAKVRPNHYAAPFSLIEHWQRNGADGPALLRSEAERVSTLLIDGRAQNLIRVFHLQNRLKGLGGGTGFKPDRVQVIGAGAMGGDIAAWCALRGQRVGLQDLARDQLARAMKRARRLFEQRLKDPRLVRDAWDRLMPDPRGDGLGGADLVIECIVEDVAAKRALLEDIESQIQADALLATNTSSIPLETLGQGLHRPQRLIGLHFFNPVARMQLVEVVHGQETDTQALDAGLAFVRRLGRLPLPVRSSPGFLVNRVLMPYLLEALDMLQEGVPAPIIDAAAVDFGMPMGPIALADSVGLDICLSVTEKLGPGPSAQAERPPLLAEMVRKGLLGRKSGQGFYRYRKGEPVKQRLPFGYRAPKELAERMVFRLLNEAVACLREGVVEDADLVDAGVIFGTGFAPFRGGPMHYIKEGGWSEMRRRLKALEYSHGGQFRPDLGWNRPVRV